LIEQRKVEQRELRVTQMTWEADGVVSVRLARIESDGPAERGRETAVGRVELAAQGKGRKIDA